MHALVYRFWLSFIAFCPLLFTVSIAQGLSAEKRGVLVSVSTEPEPSELQKHAALLRVCRGVPLLPLATAGASAGVAGAGGASVAAVPSALPARWRWLEEGAAAFAAQRRSAALRDQQRELLGTADAESGEAAAAAAVAAMAAAAAAAAAAGLDEELGLTEQDARVGFPWVSVGRCVVYASVDCAPNV